MGVSSRGRFAVLTNYRTHHTMIDKTATSRGKSDQDPIQYCLPLSVNRPTYNLLYICKFQSL